MGGVQLAAVECNYKEIDRQLKDQFIYGLNDNEMLAKVRKLTKKKLEHGKWAGPSMCKKGWGTKSPVSNY